MKKFIDDPYMIVEDYINGFIKAYPNRVRQLKGTRAIIRKIDPGFKKVAVITGGGSGHEPASTGFIGEGLTDVFDHIE